MPHSPHTPLGTIAELWRYPVKSMQGEPLRTARPGARGITGDRVYALVEQATGRIVSAKYPRKWRTLLACRARFMAEPQPDARLPPVAISLPDGENLGLDALSRPRVSCTAPSSPKRFSQMCETDSPLSLSIFDFV